MKSSIILIALVAAITINQAVNARPSADEDSRIQERQLFGGGFTLGHSQGGYQQSSGYQQAASYGSSGYNAGGVGGYGPYGLAGGYGPGLGPYGPGGFGGGLPYGGGAGYQSGYQQQGSGYQQSSGGYSQGGLSAGFGIGRR